MLSSLLFAVLFVGTAAIAQGIAERTETISFTVAIDGDVAGAADFLAGLDRAHLVVKPEPSASGAVRAGDAALGITLPTDLDDTIAGGGAIELDVHQRAEQNTSLEAFGWLVDSLNRRYGDGPELRIVEEDVTRDVDANRTQFARTLAAIAAFLCVGVVTNVASLLGSTRERRGAEALLVLPVPRSSIAAGTAIGSGPMAVLYLGTGLAVLSLAAALPLPTLGQSGATVVAMLATSVVVAVLLATLAAALGTVAGSLGGGSDDALGLGDLLAMPFAAVGVFLLVVPGLSASLTTSLLPFVGALLVLREGAAGDLEPTQLAAAIASTSVVSAGLVALAGRLLDDERNVRRLG